MVPSNDVEMYFCGPSMVSKTNIFELYAKPSLCFTFSFSSSDKYDSDSDASTKSILNAFSHVVRGPPESALFRLYNFLYSFCFAIYAGEDSSNLFISSSNCFIFLLFSCISASACCLSYLWYLYVFSPILKYKNGISVILNSGTCLFTNSSLIDSIRLSNKSFSSDITSASDGSSFFATCAASDATNCNICFLSIAVISILYVFATSIKSASSIVLSSITARKVI